MSNNSKDIKPDEESGFTSMLCLLKFAGHYSEIYSNNDAAYLLTFDFRKAGNKSKKNTLDCNGRKADTGSGGVGPGGAVSAQSTAEEYSGDA